MFAPVTVVTKGGAASSPRSPICCCGAIAHVDNAHLKPGVGNVNIDKKEKVDKRNINATRHHFALEMHCTVQYKATCTLQCGGNYDRGDYRRAAYLVGGYASGGWVQTNSGGSAPINPLILGLFESLPPDGTTWTAEGAVDWLQAAAANLRVVYGVQENMVVSAAPRGN
ncbi:hypothetical protein QO004_006037 [Rhizobium mesoamericanum]|uniref:hypothetical protein n=1 Tax=Rhizobium mesoamericanum TaxID=1079800 RepID=UPI0027898242|nr:hypothetical protein [Rhizobium mesoamericanum]MDQ0564219.1 hypothetical protein [Rhizobium mesoamericanum]